MSPALPRLAGVRNYDTLSKPAINEAIAMTVMRGRVSSSGRLGLPAEVRRAVGLDRGGEVVIELDGADIRIRTVADVVRRAQTLARAALADNGVSVT